MLQNCTAARYQTNKERMVRISEYSREMFRRFEAQTGMNFEGRKKGTLQIFRQAKEVEAVEQDIAVLERYGVPYRRLKPEECAEFEPALARVTAKIAGGLHLPADATGDCHLFTENLYKLCQENGVQFHFNQTISRIDHNGLRIQAVETETGRFERRCRCLRARLLQQDCVGAVGSQSAHLSRQRLFLDPAGHKHPTARRFPPF